MPSFEAIRKADKIIAFIDANCGTDFKTERTGKIYQTFRNCIAEIIDGETPGPSIPVKDNPLYEFPEEPKIHPSQLKVLKTTSMKMYCKFGRKAPKGEN